MQDHEPTTFGAYELLEHIASGGMAETFRARRHGSAGVSKQLLIKKIRPEFAGDEKFVSMFIQEARISAGLSHGNIAQVFDFGEVDGQYFMAMEYVEGSALSRLLYRAERQGEQLSIPCVLFIASELCKGLHYAHTRRDEEGRPLQIVHRDVTPSNILISYEGQVKIVDFGVAKALHSGNRETEPGIIKGKLSYHAPEQILGRKDLDARVDLFATGVVLYRMLCGRLPFEGAPQEIMAQTVAGTFPPPRLYRSDVPAELEALVVRAMSVNRERRPPSAHALGQELLTLLHASPPAFDSLSLAAVMAKAFSREPPHLTLPQVEEAQPAARDDETPLFGQAPSMDSVTARAAPRHEGLPRMLRRGVATGVLGLLAGAVWAGALWLKSEPPAPPALEPEAISMAARERHPEAAPAPEPLTLPSGAPVGGVSVPAGAAPAVAARPPPSEARVSPPNPELSRAEAAPEPKRQAEVVSLEEGRRLFRDGKYAQARSVLKKVVTAEPTNAMAHLLLGRTYRKLGDTSLASKHLRRFQELTPGHRGDARINRVIENMRRGKP